MEIGGNYAVTAIITAAYEVLGELLGELAHETFSRALPDEWKPVSNSLYDALRNGIVHGYATKVILVDASRVEIGVSWRSHEHLSRDGQMGFVDCPTMAADLRFVFEDYESDLRADPDLRDRFITRRKKGHVATVGDESEKAAWEQLVTKSTD